MRRLSLIALAAIAAACRGGIDPSFPQERPAESLQHDMIVLGEQLEDPYSVDNVTKALRSLYPTKAERIDVVATDLYVRFLPVDESQYERLELLCPNLTDHPLDYAILREGDYYHDPSVPEDRITWQYAVVPPDFLFPRDIIYEVLDHCFISENAPATRADGIDWEAVERESYRLTGNGDALLPLTRAGDSAAPSGRIAIVDSSVDDEPTGVKGVKVSCNSFVKFASAYTDDEGYYKMGKTYSSDVRYRIVFKNIKGFGIGFNLLLVPASISTLGKNPPEGVSVVIGSDSDRKLFCRAVVNNAGYDYYSSCTNLDGNIKTPPANLRIWLFQHLTASSAVMMQQGVMIDHSLIGEFLGQYSPLLKIFMPDITLGLSGLDSYDDIYATAMHELAHASHFMSVGSNWWDTLSKYMLKSYLTSGGVMYGVGTESDHGYCEVAEDWAYYVQTKMYRERYEGSSRTFGTSWWFSPQIFMFMDDRGLTRYKIFYALGSDVTDKDALKSRLVSLYPECRSIINQAFIRYN